MRQRALVHVLSLSLFGKSYPIPEMPKRLDLVGLDMSGSGSYPRLLASRLGYVNTFLHKKPFLNIVAPEQKRLSTCDFLMSSDVLEHVEPPVSRAFENCFSLLRPGGTLVLTVPYVLQGQTREHFPELHKYRIEKRGSKRILINETRDGRVQEFDDLVFHGGEGDTLEMRVFSESSLLEQLKAAGFVDVRVHREHFPEFGIIWREAWSLPVSARRPA